jgi:hypothetical protein
MDEPLLTGGETSEQKGISALWFGGHWGEAVKNKEGWSGPKGPVESDAWRHFENSDQFVERLSEDYSKGRERYSDGGIFLAKVLQSRHTL